MTDDRVSTPDQAPPEHEGIHDDGEWVPLKSAAEAIGRSVSTLRKKYQAGQIEKRNDDDGRVLLNLEELRRLYSDTTTGTPSTPKSEMVPLSVIAQIRELGEQITELTARAAVAEREATFAAERRQEAERRAAALEAELAALRNVANPEPTTGGTEPEPLDRADDTPPSSWWRRLRSGR